MKDYTGDIEKWKQCRNFLQKKGHRVSSAIHLGNDEYEFKEDGWHEHHYTVNIHKIKAWVNS